MVDNLDRILTEEISIEQIGLVALFFVIAWLVHLISRWIAGRIVRLDRFASETLGRRSERMRTLRELLSSVISFFAFMAAVFFSLSLFIDRTTLIWMIGLFSAAFGLGARPLFSDLLSGISFIFEDTFGVGEKIEIPVVGVGTVEGVIEKVNLRTTLVRSTTGELYTIPNGEIRVVRNFSRGLFSRADVTLRIEADDLRQALPLLEALGEEAIGLLPDMLEPWQIISETDQMGNHTELRLLAKARFGRAADMKPRLLALVQERFSDADIDLVG